LASVVTAGTPALVCTPAVAAHLGDRRSDDAR
jgi:hypothetical protein